MNRLWLLCFLSGCCQSDEIVWSVVAPPECNVTFMSEDEAKNVLMFTPTVQTEAGIAKVRYVVVDCEPKRRQ